MRKLPNASLSRLAEIREGKPAASPVGLASVIQAGLAHAQPTPAGLFASRTGFAPSVHELALLHALEHGVVWPTKGWRSDRSGIRVSLPRSRVSKAPMRRTNPSTARPWRARRAHP